MGHRQCSRQSLRFRFAAALVGLAAAAVCAWTPGVAWGAQVLTVLAVREAHAYRHVLVEDDRLVLVRYAIAESFGEDETPHGVDAALLRVGTSTSTLQFQRPPSPGYGLAAFYWPDDTAVTWADPDLVAEIRSNPTLYATAQSHSADIEWSSATTQTETQEELTEDLPEILQALERDDQDVEVQQYVSGQGITLAGQGLLTGTFAALVSLAPDAFEVSVEPIGEDIEFDKTELGGMGIPQLTETFPAALAAGETSIKLKLRARHHFTDLQHLVVTRTLPATDVLAESSSDVTSSCTLSADRFVVSCTSLTSAARAADLVVTYYSATEGEDSEVTGGWRETWLEFGVGWNASRMIMMLAMFAGLVALIRFSHGSAQVLPLFVLPILFAGALMGAMPLAAAMVVLGLAFMIGTAPIFARFL